MLSGSASAQSRLSVEAGTRQQHSEHRNLCPLRAGRHRHRLISGEAPIPRRVEAASARPRAAARARARACVPTASALAPFTGNALRKPRSRALAAAITGSRRSCTLCSQRFLRALLLQGLTTPLSRRVELPRLLRSSLAAVLSVGQAKLDRETRVAVSSTIQSKAQIEVTRALTSTLR